MRPLDGKRRQPITVLGLDPGTARLGYGVLIKTGARFTHITHGCLETPKGMPQPERLELLHRGLKEILDRHQPELVGVEKLFFTKNVKTAMPVAEARGIILLSLQARGLRILEFTPMQVKQAVTGYGSADKRQVQEMVKVLLRLSEIPQPDDAADALAIAYTAAVAPKY
jgi:crossover junction endodeoxyribonuclease RuvC